MTCSIRSLILDKLSVAIGRGSQFGKLEFAAQFEPLDYGLKVHFGEVFGEDAADGRTNEFAGDGVGAFQFAFVFEFEFSGDGGQRGVNVGDCALR